MNKTLLVAFVVLGCGLLGELALAVTPEFQITPRAGIGSLRVDAFTGVNESRIQRDTFGIGAGAGYLTSIGLVGEIGADSFGDLDIFSLSDSFNLTQKFIAVGYQAEL